MQTIPLLREDVKAYWGEVVRGEASEDRLREDAAGVHPRPSGADHELGWARITVHDQGNVELGRPPSFEGAFSVNGNVHHILTTDNYIRNKHVADPHVIVTEDPDAGLVIFRDSDVMTVQEYDGGKGHARTCAHDQMDWNTNPLQNQALRRPIPPPTSPWYDPLGFFPSSGNHSLAKRDDVAGGSMSSK